MIGKKYLLTLLNGIFILIVLLFVCDGLTSFEVKNQTIKSFTNFGLLILTPVLLVWNPLTLKTRKWKIISLIFPTIALIIIMIVGPMKIMFSSGSWKTQSILYQNGHLTFIKVEFQMQDVGALGYNKRTVEVIYLTDWFMIVNPVEKGIEERIEWVKVDKDVNELGLKLP